MNAEYPAALQAYWHLIVEHFPGAMALFSARDLHLVTANTCYYALHEGICRPEDTIGHLCTDAPLQQEQREVVALFRTVVESGFAYRAEASAVKSAVHGLTYWSWTLEPVVEQGQVVYLLLSATEVTTLVRARQQAEQESQRLAHVETILLSIRTVADPKVLAHSVLKALEDCFSPRLLALYRTYPSPGALSLLATQTHLPGVRPGTIFPDLLTLRTTASYAQVIQQRAPLIRTRTEASGEQADMILGTSDAAIVVYIPLWTQQCEGVLVAGLSLEDRERADQLVRAFWPCATHLAEVLESIRLQASVVDERRRLYAILDQLPEGVLLVEATAGKVSYANTAAATLLGYAVPQLVGTSLNRSAVLSPYGLSKERRRSAFRWNFALIHALWGKSSTSQELLVARPDGSELVVLSSVAPIRSANGQISEAVIVFQDITQAKRLERQKDDFFAVANHELRTPVTIIMGFAELFPASPKDIEDEMYRFAVSSIRQECEHLTQLLQELLDVTHLEEVQLHMQRLCQDLLAPLKQMMTTLVHTTQTHQLRFVLEDPLPEDTLPGWFDLSRVEQILRNLVSNAVKYSPTGTEIEVGLQVVRDAQGIPGEVVIHVKDQGMGIAASDLPHIFDRFYRAMTMEHSISGFGIGLYLTRELVRGHSGRIWVESHPGQGSTFFVALPLGETL